jgi:hypothetical protein
MKKIIFLILCSFPAILFAQSATDYFHMAANFYVNANKKNAQTTIQEGIQRFPNDQQLRNLASKIEELPDPEDDQSQQNQQNQNNQDQDSQQQEQQNQQEQSISREDAERLLNSLANDEKEVQERVRLEKAAQERRNSVRNW